MISQGGIPLGHQARSINDSTASVFSEVFNSCLHLYITDSFSSCTDLDSLVDGFNSECTGILDSIAPFKKVKLKKVSHPWLNVESRLFTSYLQGR